MASNVSSPQWTRWLQRSWCHAAGWGETYEAVRWWFLRAVGLTYFVAFVSLAGQVGVLYTERGLAPIAAYLDAVEGQLPVALIRWQEVPSLFWFNASDGFLLGTAWLGVGLGFLVCLNVGTRLALPLLWVLYLSFVSVGSPFLQYQWDALLLETGFLAALFAITSRPSWLFLWLLRWLCFRLIWLNGYVKIMVVDADYLDGLSSTWREGTAMSYHYFTQPLPAWPAWYFHHLPEGWHVATTYGVLAVELALPFLIFFGRWPRLLAAMAFAALHVGIWLAGSQAFYNLLGLALLIPLLDDRWLLAIRRWLGVEALTRRLPRLATCLQTVVAWWTRGWDIRWRGGWFQSVEARQAAVAWQSVVAAIFLAISLAMSNESLRWVETPGWVNTTLRDLAPFRLSSTYGAFAHMTRARPEIVLEGSEDGITWKEYAFPYKPGPLDRAPGWAAPFQPRVDWQMWFSALGAPSPWLMTFWQGLLTNKPEISDLFSEHPFPEAPPRYVRAVRYGYEFTDWDEGWESGNWWRRVRDRETRAIRLDAAGQLTTDPADPTDPTDR